MPKKVCYVTTLPSTLESFCLKSALYNIEKAGWDITFVSSYDDNFSKKLPNTIVFKPIEIKRGISVSGLVSMLKLFNLFRHEKFDLVQYATSNASCYASIAARMAGVPIRLYCEWGLGYVQLSGKRRLIFEFVERLVCRNSTHVRPDSISNLQIGLKEGLYSHKNACVIRKGSSCGVDLNRFDYCYRKKWRQKVREELNIPAEAFVFGYVGRFQKDKGINELLKVSIELCDSNPNLYVVFVGDYNNLEAINYSLLRIAMEHVQIIFTGYRYDVERFYAAFDCTVLPSYHEGFPTSIIESQAMGTPALVTSIPGCVDSIIPGKTGWVVPPKDIMHLKKRMLEIMADETIYEYGEKCRKYVFEYFNQEDVFRDILFDRENLLRKYQNLRKL